MSGRAGLACATCGATVVRLEPRPAHFPFCSERCQLIDLGRWLGEEFRIAGPADASGGGAESSSPGSEDE